MESLPAKTIVTKTKSSAWFGSDYNMNIYRGCCHGCIYCDSRSECYQVTDFETVKAKENALEIIASELKRKRKKGVIATGSMSDPYNPFEKKNELTRNSLKIVHENRFGIAIATKSNLVTRDIDILQDIKEHSPVIAKITITTANSDLCKKIEPHAPDGEERFAAIKSLSDAGIYCGILFMPVLPFINDNRSNVLDIVHRAYDSGAKFIYALFGLTLRDRQREYFYKRLDEHFPNIKQKYINYYANRYECISPNVKDLWNTFKSECINCGISYKMKDIIKSYKSDYQSGQLSLF
ncbi:MAG: radical SAM protein [Leptospirales bacterium]|nr:radical SAM protein [Leptospirales bacterium]